MDMDKRGGPGASFFIGGKMLCRKIGQSLEMASCAVCEKKDKCKTFIKWHEKNKDKYNGFVLAHITKYPEKYKLEVIIVATNPTRKENLIIVLDGAEIMEVIPKSKLGALSNDKKMKYAGMELLEALPRKIKLVLSIKTTQTDWDGKIKAKKAR